MEFLKGYFKTQPVQILKFFCLTSHSFLSLNYLFYVYIILRKWNIISFATGKVKKKILPTVAHQQSLHATLS